MPTLLVAETKGKQRRLLTLIFPRQTDPQATESDRWDWSELRVGSSTIQGFGLFPRANSSFNWEKLDRPAVMPYLGKETEVESHTQARVLRSVLCGNFDVVLRKELFKSEGHEWVQDGLYVVQMARSEIAVLDPPLPVISDGDTQLLQVVVEPDFGSRGVFSIDQGDEMVCYMLAEEARRLLHLPPHIFALLLRHSDDEHADRNMATHLVQFTRRQQVHVLVSAHPIFRHSAFIMGNSNEPPRGPPNLELQEMQIIPCTDDDPLLTRAGLKQDPEALEKFHIFANQHPEVLDKSTFFVTRYGSYDVESELTVVYGSSYKRTYSTWGHSGVPFKYHVPPDTWADGVWTDWADWPSRCPGWYNVNQQPVNRPAFRRTKTGKIEVVPDLSGIVKARKLGLDGSQAERRLAKLGGLLWNSSLPDQTRKIFVLPMPVHMTRMLENVEKHSVGMEEFPHDIWSLALAFHRNSARDRGLGEENSTITMLGQMGIISTQQQNFTFPKELQLDEEEKEWLRRQVAAEELPKKLRELDDNSSEDDGDDPDLDAPWHHPLGSVVWCKMKGGQYPWWPAEVVIPSVDDKDIVKMRKIRCVFVRFFGWSKSCFYWAPASEVETWEDGVGKGFLELKTKKSCHMKSFRRAKQEAQDVMRCFSCTPPLPPPPWWRVAACGPLDSSMTDEDCLPIECAAEDGVQDAQTSHLRKGTRSRRKVARLRSKPIPEPTEAEIVACQQQAGPHHVPPIKAWEDWLRTHAEWAASTVTNPKDCEGDESRSLHLKWTDNKTAPARAAKKRTCTPLHARKGFPSMQNMKAAAKGKQTSNPKHVASANTLELRRSKRSEEARPSSKINTYFRAKKARNE